MASNQLFVTALLPRMQCLIKRVDKSVTLSPTASQLQILDLDQGQS